MASRTQRASYTAQVKLTVLRYAEEHGNRAAGRKYGVDESMVRKWKKNRPELEKTPRNKRANRTGTTKFPDLETELEQFVRDQRNNGEAVTTFLIRQQARHIAKERGLKDFVGGPSWCHRFMKRAGLSIGKRIKVEQKISDNWEELMLNLNEFTTQNIEQLHLNIDKISMDGVVGMPTHTLCRVDVGRQPYFLKTTAKNEGIDGFELVITDAINSWEGKISPQSLTELAENVNMEAEEFAQLTLQALTRQNMGDLAFEYQMKADEGTGSEFSWKKVMANENIKFQLGSVSLHVVDDPAESIQDLFIFMIQNASSLSDTIHVLERENERLSTERGNALKRLGKCVGKHEETEKELFTKFQVVLNDKKAKIRSLKQEVSEAFSAGKMTERGSNSSKRPPLVSNSSGEESNEEAGDSEDEEISTDEESKATQRSKRKTVSASRLDSSFILDEEPTNEKAAPAGKRRRRREVTNKQTPSKPSIPKVSSVRTERSETPSTTAASEGGRVSTSTSGRSSKSDPDADMLFDEL